MAKKRDCERKRRYKDEIAALLHLAEVERADPARPIGKEEKRAYYCSVCKGWHLTSQTAGDRAERQRRRRRKR